MEKRRLGLLEVPALGFGCMVLPGFYFPGDEAQAIATLHRAEAIGVNFLDTADIYGGGKNEELVGRAIKGRRERYLIATKFGNVLAPNAERDIDGRPEYVAAACEASLRRLGIDAIDLYYQHRVDPRVPIEETVGAMKRLVKQGKVRYLGLSEAAPATHPSRAQGAPDRRAADRIFALVARRRGRTPAALPRARHRLRRLLAARARHVRRRDPRRREPRGQ